ncbi:protein of unknown function [Hyphomicrobium sp. MC1]|nr:protein of unknown function [Hyphomicrobium sp. MC1]
MSLTSYRAAPPRVTKKRKVFETYALCRINNAARWSGRRGRIAQKKRLGTPNVEILRHPVEKARITGLARTCANRSVMAQACCAAV